MLTKNKIFNNLSEFGKKANDLKETLNYVLLRTRLKINLNT